MKEKRKSNNKKKRKQTDKDRKEEAGTGSIVKEWELNDFFVHLS